MKIIICLLPLVLLLFASNMLLAHGGEGHKKE